MAVFTNFGPVEMRLEARDRELTAGFPPGLGPVGMRVEPRFYRVRNRSEAAGSTLLQCADGRARLNCRKLTISRVKVRVAGGKVNLTDGKVRLANGKVNLADDEVTFAGGEVELASGGVDRANGQVGRVAVEVGVSDAREGSSGAEAQLAGREVPRAAFTKRSFADKRVPKCNLGTRGESI
jgi:hypothetical protein